MNGSPSRKNAHTELSCWQHRAALWETRYRAEAGLPITGWWRDLHAAPEELVWFAELPAEEGREEPWCVSVWHDQPAGPWHWDLSWNPSQGHRSEREIDAGQHVVAWQAMEHALAAWDRRPRGKGVACPRCYGWGYWCEHGGGPAHPCDDEAACECTACDGGVRAASAAEGEEHEHER